MSSKTKPRRSQCNFAPDPDKRPYGMCESMCEQTFGRIGSNDSHGVDCEGGVVPLVRDESHETHERRRTPRRNPHEPDDAPHVDDTLDRPFEGLVYRVVVERRGDFTMRHHTHQPSETHPRF